ncbi:hypothetical protein [Deinococcus sp. JMULE3]|uniref:hypothetical protein n=1 Tax=Deinococcus sp. JMULE3 TaxID=2518341 RepID=UPI0015750310|nr:hypothetical protein [Deinococcus sp. JMULE3]NTY02559.1 hypothetical protein [Deinococcus sp. JMULE3]
MPVVFIHGFSAESRLQDPASIAMIYGALPGRIAVQLGKPPTMVNVSRWISLDDGLDLEDLTLALDRALHHHPQNLLDTRFDVIVHSTGTLVIRNWIRRFCEPGKCPVDRIIHLAGAAWGSGWAHVGKSQMARWARWAMGTQRGLQVLDCLEFGSTWTADLHAAFLEPKKDMFHGYGVMEFCIIGSQVSGPAVFAPVRYGKEDGSDGVVRVSSANLNHHYVRIERNPDIPLQNIRWGEAQKYAKRFHAGKWDNAKFGVDGFDAPYYRTLADHRPLEAGGLLPQSMGTGARSRPRVPFAVVYNCSHSGEETGVVSGQAVIDSILKDLVLPALNCPVDAQAYESVAVKFDKTTLETRRRASGVEHGNGVVTALQSLLGGLVDINFRPSAQYDSHSQVIVRARDQNGSPVKHCDVFFNSLGGGDTPRIMMNDLIQDHHQNSRNPGVHTFYLRCECFEDGAWTDRLSQVRGLDLEISVVDPVTQRVLYVPLRMRLTPDVVQRFIRSDRTTIIDVKLIRLPDDQTFILA